MAEHIEARSLASLNALAGNPPQYPTNPTEEKRQPLVLYISRVPGTRDVILSTYKPHIKNVTAEDIANSLYYVHMNAASDEQFVSRTVLAEGGSPRSSLDSSRSGVQNRIQRKPLPREANLPPDGTEPPSHAPAAGFGSHGTGNFRDQLVTREIGSATAYTAPSSSVPPRPPIHRKPLGPRDPKPDLAGVQRPSQPHPPPQRSEGDITNVLPRKPNDRAVFLNPQEQLNLPPRPDEIPDYPYNPLAPPIQRADQSPSPSKRKPFVPYSLALIRRDPSSGQQWNVGKVESFELENPDLISPEAAKHLPSPTISVRLETSGYARFRGIPRAALKGNGLELKELTESLDAARPSTSGSRGFEPGPFDQSRQDVGHDLLTSSTFERKVKMTYTPSFTSNLKNAFRRPGSLDSDAGHESSWTYRSRQKRKGSTASVASVMDADFDIGDRPIFTAPGDGLRRHGYAFLSPWDGRCEFRTGNGGRSLRCRHVLPVTGGWNPLVNSADRESGFERANKDVREVSELRFNLPSSEIFGKDEGAQPHEGKQRARDRIFNAMINKTEDENDDDEYQSYGLDLSLGRERAGGGNRGKRAKMGKLIIYEEGLKMLDLLVAANIGVWWGVWERRLE